MPRLHWPNSDESERKHFTTWWRCNWSSPICRSFPFLAIPQIFYSISDSSFYVRHFLPNRTLYARVSKVHSLTKLDLFMDRIWFLAYTILYSFSCEARFKSLLPHLRSMRSNRFMWDLQKITRSRIMILSINRPEDAGIWKSKD